MALIKDFSKIAGGAFANLLIGLFTTPIITRIVNPDEYGNWSLFCVYSSVLSSILLLGTDYTIARYYYKSNDISYHKAVTKWCCLISIIAILFASIPIIFVVHRFRPNWNYFILCVLIVNIFLNVLNRLINLLLRFENRINHLALTTILQKIFFVAIAVISVFYIETNHFEFLSVSTVVSTGFIVILCYCFIRSLFQFKECSTVNLPKREMFCYGIPLMFSGCTYLLFQATDKLAISHFCSEQDLGIYASAGSFLSIFAIIQSAFTTVWWPAVMKNYEQNPTNKSLYIKTNDLICFITSIIGFTFILLKDLVILLLGENYRAAIVVLPFIIFQPILYTLSETTVIGLNFQKKSKILFVISLVSLLFNVIVNILLTRHFGIIGTSIAVGLSYIFFTILRTFISYKYYKINFHFVKMFTCIFLLFIFALIHTIYSNHILSYLLAVVFYGIVFIFYKDYIVIIKEKFFIFIRKSILRKV